MVRRKYDHVYQVKIVLRGIEPPIWRCIQVPEDYTFWDLHVAIQDAMGWLDYHLHAFEITNRSSHRRDTIGIPDDEWEDEIHVLAGWQIPISTYFGPDNRVANYLYDFGDSWEHTVTVEKVLARDGAVRYPVCLDGARRGPPEDCGGVPGYEQLLRILADPANEDRESMLAWIGEPYDAEAFAPEQVRFDDPDERWKIAFQGA
jgi:hypothetical protein